MVFGTTGINEGFNKLSVLNPNHAAAEILKNYILNNISVNSVVKK